MALTYPLAWPIDPSTGNPMLAKEIDINLVNSSKSGGQSGSGIEQVVASPAARWEAKFTMPAMLPQAVLVWRGFIAAMQGRVGTVLVPAFEFGRQPWPVDALGRIKSPDRIRNPDLKGTLFAVDPAVDPTIEITVAAAALNATELVLTTTVGGPILAGHRFSIGGSLYEVAQASDNPDGTTIVDIRPWLRVAIGAGTPCEFAYPVCAMRFKTDDEGALRFTSHRTASPIFSVVEAF